LWMHIEKNWRERGSGIHDKRQSYQKVKELQKEGKGLDCRRKKKHRRDTSSQFEEWPWGKRTQRDPQKRKVTSKTGASDREIL